MRDKYLAVIQYFDRAKEPALCLSEPHPTPQECDTWLAEKLREHGNERVICFITEIKFIISG